MNITFILFSYWNIKSNQINLKISSSWQEISNFTAFGLILTVLNLVDNLDASYSNGTEWILDSSLDSRSYLITLSLNLKTKSGILNEVVWH